MARRRNNEKRKVVPSPMRQEPPFSSSQTMRHQVTQAILPLDVVPSLKPKTKSRSSPISLPESHIHRTPSEAQLSDEILRAERRDDVMYSRLLTGILTQMKRSASDDWDDAALRLSIKSVESIVKTKRSNCELEQHVGDRYDWEMPLGDDQDGEYSASSSPHEALSWSSSSRYTSEESLSMLLHPAERIEAENDCVFSLEL